MARTFEEIKAQIDGLKRQKETLPEFDFFGTNNHEQIDAKIDILEGMKLKEDFIHDDELYFAAQDAEDWLYGDKTDDLFD